jgi:hypothetical protein
LAKLLDLTLSPGKDVTPKASLAASAASPIVASEPSLFNIFNARQSL